MAAKPGRSDKVLSSIFMSTGLTGLSVIVDLVIMAIISRLIPPSEFGVLAAAMFLLAVCNLLREGGIGSALIQFKTLEPRLIQAGFTLAMGWSILLFVVIQITAPWYASFIRIPQLGDVLRVLSLIFPIQAFSLIGQALLQRRLKSPLAATCELAARAFSYLVIGVTLAYSGWGYWALVAAWIGEACILSVLMVVIARPPLLPVFDLATFRLLTSRTSGFAASKIITFVALRADDVIVGRYLDAASLGLYVRAYKLMSQPANLYTTVADRVVFPAFSQLQEDLPRLRAAFLRGTNLTAMVGIPLSVLFYVVAPELIGLLLGKDWSGVIPVFSVLAVATYFRIGARVSASLLKATASFRQMIASQVFYAFLTIGLSLFAVQYGLVAVGIAIGCAVIAWFCMVSLMACSVLGIGVGEFLKAHGQGLALAILSGGGSQLIAQAARAEGLPQILILFLIGSFIGCFLLALFFFKPRIIIGTSGLWIIEQIQDKALRAVRKR